MRQHFLARARETGALDKPTDEECCACDQKATHWVRIAWTYVRGEDDVEKACRRHHDMAKGRFDRFSSQMRSKARTIERKGGASDAG